MSDKLDLRRIATEQRNPRTAHIDELPTIDMVRLINSEDKKVAEAVELGMGADFMKEIMQAIHEESVHQQMEIINK